MVTHLLRTTTPQQKITCPICYCMLQQFLPTNIYYYQLQTTIKSNSTNTIIAIDYHHLFFNRFIKSIVWYKNPSIFFNRFIMSIVLIQKPKYLQPKETSLITNNNNENNNKILLLIAYHHQDYIAILHFLLQRRVYLFHPTVTLMRSSSPPKISPKHTLYEIIYPQEDRRWNAPKENKQNTITIKQNYMIIVISIFIISS